MDEIKGGAFSYRYFYRSRAYTYPGNLPPSWKVGLGLLEVWVWAISDKIALTKYLQQTPQAVASRVL